MNNFSPDEAFSLINKWREELSILQFVYRDVNTGETKSLWVLANSVTSGGNPRLLMSLLSDPFPFLAVDLTDATFEYGDTREFEGMVAAETVKSAKAVWECFLKIAFPTGTNLLLSELRRGELELGMDDL